MKTDSATDKCRSRRKRSRASLRNAGERARIGFSDIQLRQMVDEIKAEAHGESCGGCEHAIFGDRMGACTLWGVNIHSRTAIACKRWCKRG